MPLMLVRSSNVCLFSGLFLMSSSSWASSLLMRFVRLFTWSLMSVLVALSLAASRRLFSLVRSPFSWLRRRARALVWACASLGGCQALGSWLWQYWAMRRASALSDLSRRSCMAPKFLMARGLTRLTLERCL